jgi:hypothetical protein
MAAKIETDHSQIQSGPLGIEASTKGDRT